jgi:hypothetical protein
LTPRKKYLGVEAMTAFASTALRDFEEQPLVATPAPARQKIRLVRHRRDTAVSESEIFSLLHHKEEECCDRATD